jgi:endonuclease YncB( thermonuclease family)
MLYKVFLMTLVIVTSAFAREPVDDPLPGPVPARVLHVIDGDTVRVRARIWLGQEVETNVRLSGVDTAETHAHCDAEQNMADKATDFVMQKLPEGDLISLTDVTYDKYGKRVVAHILTATGQDLSTLLLKSGLAHVYGGGHKKSWCERD